MVLIVYSDKKYEYQAISCIKSLQHKITNDIKIVYFTIGFQSDFLFRGLVKIEIPINTLYPSFHYYKPELCLKAMYIFSEENYFVFSDTDVLFSKRFNFDLLKHENEYPLAPFGPHEYPYIYQIIDGEIIHYNEVKLMNYLNVAERSMRYVWSCFFSFNRRCKDFMEEYSSVCQNKYLIDRAKWYYPFYDETGFNVLLWKRKAINNLGFCFVNTHDINTIIKTETDYIKDEYGNNIDQMGANWEYVYDSEKVIFYHGVKIKEDIEEVLKHL